MFYLLALGVFIGSGFKPFNQKVNTQNYLAVPVSTFEKYLTEFLFRVVIGTIGLFVIYWIAVNLARYAAILTLTEPTEIVPFRYSTFFRSIFKYSGSSQVAFAISSVLFSYIALFNVRLFFNKNGFIKALLTLSTLLFAFITLLYYSVKYIFEPMRDKYASVNFEVSENYISSILIVGIVGLSIFGYFKLKEKEL